MKDLGLNRLSRGNDTHRETKDGLPDPRTEYYKYIVVRHPLERIASAYNDRVRGAPRRHCVKNIKVRGGLEYHPVAATPFDSVPRHVNRFRFKKYFPFSFFHFVIRGR